MGILAGVFFLAVMSVCWTGKQPPKLAALRQRTVQASPVEAEFMCQPRSMTCEEDEEAVYLPPTHFMSVGNATLRLREPVEPAVVS